LSVLQALMVFDRTLLLLLLLLLTRLQPLWPVAASERGWGTAGGLAV